MATYFTSDTHYGHANIIKYSNRPFKDVAEMDREMIDRWNHRVQPGDTVYHLGDFGFSDEEAILKVLRRLNGQKFLIFGNHDKVPRKSKAIQQMFNWTGDYKEVDVTLSDGVKQRIILCHYPMITWHKAGRGSWMLHGHCHHNLRYPFDGKIIDAGVDGKDYDYAPISVRQVESMMAKRAFTALDHHGADV